MLLFLSSIAIVLDANEDLEELSRTEFEGLDDSIAYLDCCSAGIQYSEDHSFIVAFFLDQEEVVEDHDRFALIYDNDKEETEY